MIVLGKAEEIRSKLTLMAGAAWIIENHTWCLANDNGVLKLYPIRDSKT